MNIAYFLELGDSTKDMLGVIKKVNEKIIIWKQLGHTVRLIVQSRVALKELDNHFTAENASIYVLGPQRFKGHYHVNNLLGIVHPIQKKIIQDLAQFRPDVFYFRSILPSPIVNYSLENFKCFYECNTYIDGELNNLSNENFFGKLYKILYRRNKYNIYCRTSGVIALTNEIAKEIKGYNPIVNQEVIPNGIALQKGTDNSTPTLETFYSNTPTKMVFIGSPGASWHGLDHILEFAKMHQDRVCIDIIGFDGMGEQALPNVKFHGILPKEVYEKIIANSDIGLGTFALYRKQMDEACPLKVREYLKFGLPVVLGYSDTAFINKDVPFVYQVPNTADGLISHANEVLDFCNIWRGKKLKTEEVRPFIDTYFFEEKRLKFIEQTLRVCN